MKFCPWCGKTLADPNAKFCNECGHRLVRPAENIPARRPVPPTKGADEFLREAESLNILGREPPELVEAALRRSEERFHKKEEMAPDVALRLEPDEERPSKEALSAGGGSRPPRRKGRTLLALLCVVLVMTALGGGLFALLKMQENGPKKAAAEFAQAISAGDVAFVQSHLAMSDKEFTNADSVSRLCQSVSATVPAKTMEAHLAALGDSASVGYNNQLSCFTMVKGGSALSGKYYLQIDPVPVVVETAVEDITFLVDGVETPSTPGQGEDEGRRTLQMLPGNHTIQGVVTVHGADYPMGEESVSTFSVDPKTISSFVREAGSLRVELTGTETNLKIRVGGKDAGLKSKRGMVVVEPAFQGMAVSLACEEYTQEITATGAEDQRVQVDAIAQASEQPAPADPAQMTNRQLVETAAPQYFAFYNSYLEATNEWDPKLITNLYEGYADAQLQNMNNYNKGLLFKLISLQADRESVLRGELDGAFTVAFYVETKTEYRYKDKGDTMWYAGGNRQEVTMRYNAQNRKWELCASKINNDLTLSDNLISPP